MSIITLYRFTRPDGGETVSPRMPTGVAFTTLLRLVADEGMELVKGDIHAPCVDVENEDAENWTEVPVEES